MNKTEKLIDYIGQIDDDIIAEADVSSIRTKPIKHLWLKWAAIAAAAAVCLFISISFMRNLEQPSNLSELPMLTVNTEFGTFGFEGYMAFDVSELIANNPWTKDSNLSVMPVFTNPTLYEASGKPLHGLSADKMILKAEDIASVMGLTVDSIYTEPTEEELRMTEEKERSIPGNERFIANSTPVKAVAICGDVTIHVEASGEISIWFENSIPLPDEYSFTHYDTTEQQAKDTMQYLLKMYEPLVAMQSPALALFGDYDIYAQRSFTYTAFENAGDLTERILGFHFNRIDFYNNEDGELYIIRRSSDNLLSQKIGDYPIITEKEARKLLLDYQYITSVPEAFPGDEFLGEEYIAHVELIYRKTIHDTVFMPYYRYLVELPAMQRENGLKNYGAFYVPAVERQYLTNMPVWDGSFN